MSAPSHMKILPTLLMICALGSGCSRNNQQIIPYESLLERLVDGNQMARVNDTGATLISSHDRSGANNDFNHFSGTGPDGWMIVADLEGPGYISRFWFTGSKDGTKRLRFYFDGEKSPSIETTMDQWMGKSDPLTLPLAGYEPYCWFSWLPVPFNKRLVITEEPPVTGEKLYYHLAYHKLPPEQTVESLEWPLSAGAISKINEIKKKWSTASIKSLNGEEYNITVPSKERTRAANIKGPALIREIQFRPDWNGFSSAVEIEQALRDLIIRIYWDGQLEPSVEVPLGALCGSMWTRMRYQSLHFGLTNETLMIQMPMPFNSAADLEIENWGDRAVPINIQVALGSHEAGLGYFHSGWKKSLPQQVGTAHTILQTTGDGTYAGCILGVQSYDQSWWVFEGDELMWIDGEATPSWRGTGLEDYFNGGWYYANAIASPLQGMPYKVHFRNIQYRLHQSDPVNFSSAFNMVFERGPDNASRAIFESVSFYYLSEPIKADSDVERVSPHPEPDPLMQQTLMFELNDRERLGDIRGAKDAITRYLDVFPDSPFRDDLKKRMAHYDSGVELPAGQALLGVYANMPVTVFINGAPVGRFGNPQSMQFKLIELPPGRHVIAAQAPRQQYPDWVQIGIMTSNQIIGTDRSWKYSFNQSPGWNKMDFDDSGWPEHDYVWVKGPPEEPFIFSQPHPYPFISSKPWGIRPPKDWPAGAQTVFYRKEFQID